MDHHIQKGEICVSPSFRQNQNYFIVKYFSGTVMEVAFM